MNTPPYQLYPHQVKALDSLIRPGTVSLNIERGAGKAGSKRTAIKTSLDVFRFLFGRTHKKRRGQSEAYHKRIQKKWDRRFLNYYPVPELPTFHREPLYQDSHRRQSEVPVWFWVAETRCDNIHTVRILKERPTNNSEVTVDFSGDGHVKED